MKHLYALVDARYYNVYIMTNNIRVAEWWTEIFLFKTKELRTIILRFIFSYREKKTFSYIYIYIYIIGDKKKPRQCRANRIVTIIIDRGHLLSKNFYQKQLTLKVSLFSISLQMHIVFVSPKLYTMFHICFGQSK